ALAGVLCGLLPATRTIGMAAAVAAAAYVFGVTRRTRPRAAFLAGLLAPWFAAAAWSMFSVHADPGLARSGLLGPPYSALLPKGTGEALQVVALNVVRFADDFLTNVLPGLPAADANRPWQFGLRVAAIVALASLAVVAFRPRRRGPPAARAGLLAGYGLLLLPWPFADTRFLVPVAALAVAWIGEGAAAPFARRVGVGPRAAGVAAFVGLAAWAAPATAALFRETAGCTS